MTKYLKKPVVCECEKISKEWFLGENDKLFDEEYWLITEPSSNQYTVSDKYFKENFEEVKE